METSRIPARRWRVLLVLSGVVLALGLRPAWAEERDGEESSLVELRDGWEYRAGDSPVDAQGRFIWIGEDRSETGWRSYEIDGEVEGDERFMWLRIALPGGEWNDPALLVQPRMVFEAYLGDRLLYRSGELREAFGNKFQVMHWHLVPLPEGFRKQTLYLRIFTNDADLIGLYYTPSLGNRSDHITCILQKSLDRVVIGSILALMGLFGLYVFVRRREPIVLAFSILSFCVGLYTVASADMRKLVMDAPAFWWYLYFVPFFSFSIGLWVFFEQFVTAAHSRRRCSRMWQGFAVFAVLALVVDLTDLATMVTVVNIYMGLLTVAIIAASVMLFRDPSRKTTEFKVLTIGSLFLTGTGLHDILRGFQILPGDFFIFHWGVFVFLLFLAYIVEHRFAAAHEELQRHSRELEDRVEARTRDLSVKNEQLEEALRELRATQEQLVMREKMASLGNLVAGVAHEVNNPIGAVNSAADVARRCIERIVTLLKKGSGWEELEANRPFQQALKLLGDNVGLISGASERIVTIVRSLKNFARLDEAEFMRADLREGLESTLALVQHELKNKAEVIEEYGEVPPIACYPNQLNQVFMNLLVNAAQAIDGKGTITIRTFAEGERACVQIADTGKGIAPEHIERVFDPGFTTKGVGVGTGLGLSISYNIVQQHDGEIRVDSGPGKGTTFTVWLPIRREEG